MLSLDTALVSHIGDRADNQDRAEILITDESVFAVVADGMGGHAKGDLAAETAVVNLLDEFRLNQHHQKDPESFFRSALARAQKEVLALGQGMPATSRPGAMVVCVLIHNDILYWAHIGDSRTYHLRGTRLLARTRDHTMVEALVSAGEITPVEALTHPERHLVEYCLGVDDGMPLDTIDAPRTLARGDTVLLCTDGLWAQLDETFLLQSLASADDLEQNLEQLVTQAVECGRGMSDNVTAIALRVLAEEDE